MSDQTFDPRRFGKTARNEQRKLVATSFNTAGLAVLGLGFLTPLFGSGAFDQSWFKSLLAWAMFLILHAVAQRVLTTMEE